MIPTRAQLFFASPWFDRVWFGSFGLLGTLVVGGIVLGFMNPFSTSHDLLEFTFLIGLGGLLGLVLGAFPGCLFLVPILMGREMKNGGPFKVGDEVQILSGPHSGRVASIYTIQELGPRVQLGPKEREELNDVFAPTQLLLIERGQGSADNLETRQ